MTISIQSTSKSTAGNGSVTQFPYDFKIFKAEDLTVIIRAADGAETVLSQTNPVQYQVTGVGADAGGIVVINDTSLTPSGTTVLCIRTASFTQETDYTPNDPFPAADHENALDRLTMLVQQANEKADRSIKLSRTNTMNSTEFTKSPTDRANQILAFDGNGELSVEAGKIKTVTTTVSAVSAGGSPTGTSTYTQSTGDLALNFGLVTGNTGPQGNQGIQGIQGDPAGFKFQYDENVTADQAPQSGYFHRNSSNWGLVSKIYLGYVTRSVNGNSSNIQGLITSFNQFNGDHENGTLKITIEGNTTNFVLFKVGNIVDTGSYYKINVEKIADDFTNSPFVDDVNCVLTFVENGKHSKEGLSYDFSISSTDSDPGNGVLRANVGGGGINASTSQLFISKTDKLGAVTSAFLTSWDDAGNASNVPQGTLQMTSVENPNKYVLYSIQGNVVDTTNYVKVPVSLINFNSSAANSGAFQAGENVTLHFTRAGSNATIPTGSALAMAYLFG